MPITLIRNCIFEGMMYSRDYSIDFTDLFKYYLCVFDGLLAYTM